MSVDANRAQAAFLAATKSADPGQRAAILDRECGTDSELRRRVEALLRAHDEPASIFDAPAVASLSADPALRAWQRDVAATTCSNSSARQNEKEAAEPSGLAFLEPPTKPGSLGRLGHYEILEILGQGGFGIVFRALDEVLQRVVAVKVLAPELATTSPARKRFLREARSSAAIRHENVVQVYAVEEQPLPYLVMEFIPGQTLQQLLDQTGPLDVPEILRIGCQIAEGLAAAHETGLIHRDVKPANVLIEDGPRRRAKLTDFGLARAADDASISQSGVVAGTPLYMAPEQARGQTLDHRADLFSLGSVLYVMCTGRPPFRAAEPMAILMRVCEDNPRPIREIIPETPIWLCDVISRLHAKDRAKRFQSAREVVDLLQRYQNDLKTRGAVVPVSLGQARSRRSWNVALAAAIGVLYIVVLMGVLARWLPRHSDERGNESPRTQVWQPPPLLTADELAEMSNPFDELDRKDLPRQTAARMFGGADRVPPELVAVLDGSPLQLHRPGRTSWFAQDRGGKWLAVPCETVVVLFDARTMAPAKTLGPAAERIYRVAFSPDGKYMAAACWADENSAVVWEVESGKRTLQLRHKGNCRSIQFSPDSNRLLTVSEDRQPIVWDAKSGEELHSFPAHEQQRVWPEAAFTSDGKWIVTWASDGVKVWDAKTWAEVKTLSGPEDPADDIPGDWHRPLVVGADGKLLAAGSEAGFKVWATDTWKEEFVAKTPATWFAVSPDGHTLLAGPHENAEGQSHVVTRWDTQTRRRIGSAVLGSRGTWAVYHLSVDGKTLYGMACDPAEPSIHVYDAATLEERFLSGHAGQVRAVDMSHDGTWIASAGSDGTVRIWDVGTRQLLHTIGRSGKTAVQAVFSPNNKTLYAAWSEDGEIRAIDPETGRWHKLGVHGPRLQRLAVSPDGALLAAAGEGGVQLWALPGGEIRGEIPGVPLFPGPVAFSPDAKTLAVGGGESVRLFDLATMHSTTTLACAGVVRWVGFRPDGRSLAAVGESANNPVHVFDLTAAGRTLRLEGHESPIQGGAWRADGGLLATVGVTDGTVRLWDFGHAIPRQRILSVFERDVPSLAAVAFSPEGRHLVTANPDGTIAIFRLAKPGGVFRVP